MDEAKIRVAKWYLKQKKTKKFVCEYLGIPYNTTKLNKLIKDFDDKQETTKRLKEKNKGQPLTETQKDAVVSYYKEGQSQTKIAELLYISTYKVKNTLLEKGIPIRGRGKKNVKTDHIKQDFTKKLKVGDLVYYNPIDKNRKPCEVEIVRIFDEHICGVVDNDGIVDERTIWEPHVNIDSKTFKERWPRGPVESQHYKVEYLLSDREEWIDRITLQMRYQEELHYSMNYGQDTYIVRENSNYGLRHFAERKELVCQN